MSPAALFIIVAAVSAEVAIVVLILGQVTVAAVLTAVAVACTCRTVHLNDQYAGSTASALSPTAPNAVQR